MNPFNPSIRLVIADDHEIFREGLKQMIGRYAKNQIEIVGDAGNGKELLSIVTKENPDVVLTDIKMPVMDGVAASKIISKNYSSVGLIALSTFDEHCLIYEMFDAGAKGYLLKNANPDEIIDAIQTVHTGRMYYCNSTSRSLVKLLAPSRHNHQKRQALEFCDSEVNIIRMICQQLTTKEIADQLHLSIKSIEHYSKNIKEKIDAKNMVGIALYAVKNDIVKLNEL